MIPIQRYIPISPCLDRFSLSLSLFWVARSEFSGLFTGHFEEHLHTNFNESESSTKLTRALSFCVNNIITIDDMGDHTNKVQ